jgi:Tol biopolymer transport system component
LFSTRTDGFESRPIDVPSADIAGISKDGQLALLLGRHHERSWLRVGTLAQVALAGGTPRELLENVYDADIAPDGKQFAVVVVEGEEQVLQFPIGKELFRTRGWISQPRIAPDGKRIAFVDHRLWGDDLGETKLIGTDEKAVLLGPEQQYVQGVCWSPDGSEVWFTVGDDVKGGTLYKVTPGDAPQLILRTPSLIRVQDVAADGRVLLMTDDTWVTLAGQLAGDASEHIYSWWANDSAAAISSDGSTYAGWTGSIVVEGEYAVFLRRGDTPPVQLTTGAAVGMSPDGKFVVTTSVARAGSALSLHPVGPGQPRPLDLGGVIASITPGQHVSFASDGRRMAFVGAKPNSGRTAWVMDVDGGAPRAVSPEGATSAIISPDGSKVAVGDAQRGMYVTSGAGNLLDLRAPKNDAPLAWSADGCCVLSWDGTLPPRIFSTSLDGGRRTLVREPVSSDPAGLTYGWLTLSPDGRYYLQRVRRVFSAIMLVDLRAVTH